MKPQNAFMGDHTIDKSMLEEPQKPNGFREEKLFFFFMKTLPHPHNFIMP